MSYCDTEEENHKGQACYQVEETSNPWRSCSGCCSFGSGIKTKKGSFCFCFLKRRRRRTTRWYFSSSLSQTQQLVHYLITMVVKMSWMNYGCIVPNSNLNTTLQHIPGNKRSNTAAALLAQLTCIVPPPGQSQPHNPGGFRMTPVSMSAPNNDIPATMGSLLSVSSLSYKNISFPLPPSLRPPPVLSPLLYLSNTYRKP